jgi:hypothetical protein
MTTPSAHLITRLVWWTPRTNSQRGALARFGSDWQLHSAMIHQTHPSVVWGRQCWFIHPVGNSEESRWVPVGQVKFKDEV